MIKKVLACVFVVLVIGFVYNNWDRLTNLDRLLNNVVDKNNETTQVVNRLTRNEEAITNSIDSLSKSIKEVNNNVDRRFNSLDNKINKVKKDLQNEMNELREQVEEEEILTTNWHYYRKLDKVSQYYTNICQTTSDEVEIWDDENRCNVNSNLTLKINDTPNNTFKITLALTDGYFRFNNKGESKIIVNFNNGFTNTRLAFDIVKLSDRTDVALIKDYRTFIKNVKNVNTFVIRTNIYKQVDEVDFEFSSQKTLDETTRG